MISKKHIQTINLNLFYCWCHYVDREEEQIENDYPPQAIIHIRSHKDVASAEGAVGTALFNFTIRMYYIICYFLLWIAFTTRQFITCFIAPRFR